MRGDASADFLKMWQKAKLKSTISTKQSVYLTHMRDERQLSLQNRFEAVTEKEMKKHQRTKGKSSGKEALDRDVQMIKKQRIETKRFIKAEVVSKELLGFCYNLLEHLQKMKECSYICEYKKVSNSGQETFITFNTNRDFKMIHELE